MREKGSKPGKIEPFESDNATAQTVCWLCGRELGKRREWHHPVPKSRGGREKVPVHPICHWTIHATFTNAELARQAGSRDAAVNHPDVVKFLDWISGKPPDFHAPTRKRH